jgi:hypothetical protein
LLLQPPVEGLVDELLPLHGNEAGMIQVLSTWTVLTQAI